MKRETMTISPNDKIHDFIDPYACDNLSSLPLSMQKDLLNSMQNYLLEMRVHLGFCPQTTFGMELEFDKCSVSGIKYRVNHDLAGYWRTIEDRSILNGGEVVSPVLKDQLVSYNSLCKVCRILGQSATITDRCSGHIHVGAQELGDNLKYWQNFLLLWSVYENVIFRFSYGEYLSARSTIDCYAESCAEEFFKAYEKLKKGIVSNLDNLLVDNIICRPNAVNLSNVSSTPSTYETKNTIEFRCPNGTFEPVIWQNNVNLFVSLIDYAKSPEFNEELILRRKQALDFEFGDSDYYHEIFLEQALELSDLIFDNNFDKIYFLRQYLKDNEVYFWNLKKSKPFIKKLILKTEVD